MNQLELGDFCTFGAPKTLTCPGSVFLARSGLKLAPISDQAYGKANIGQHQGREDQKRFLPPGNSFHPAISLTPV